MNKNLTYAGAIAELETIVSEIENASIGVDELSEKVKRAASLIRFCREKLTATEKDVNTILKSLDNEPSVND